MLPLEDNPGTVPQEAIDETAPVAAARAHLGNSVRDRPLERYLAEPNNPANAAAIAKGISQFEESVYRQGAGCAVGGGRMPAGQARHSSRSTAT